MKRVIDALAVVLVLLLAYRLFFAPCQLAESAAYPAPAVTYQTLSGPKFALARERGRVVFLEFYASWCTPCKTSLPLVESFARAHPEVRVVPVDVGEPRVVAQAFARQRTRSRRKASPRRPLDKALTFPCIDLLVIPLPSDSGLF